MIKGLKKDHSCTSVCSAQTEFIDLKLAWRGDMMKHHLASYAMFAWRSEASKHLVKNRRYFNIFHYFLCEGMDTSEPSAMVAKLSSNHFNHQTINKAFRWWTGSFRSGVFPVRSQLFHHSSQFVVVELSKPRLVWLLVCLLPWPQLSSGPGAWFYSSQADPGWGSSHHHPQGSRLETFGPRSVEPWRWARKKSRCYTGQARFFKFEDLSFPICELSLRPASVHSKLCFNCGGHGRLFFLIAQRRLLSFYCRSTGRRRLKSDISHTHHNWISFSVWMTLVFGLTSTGKEDEAKIAPPPPTCDSFSWSMLIKHTLKNLLIVWAR